jgi:hypothetical protein
MFSSLTVLQQNQTTSADNDPLARCVNDGSNAQQSCDRLLVDIGVSQDQALSKGYKPFWK